MDERDLSSDQSTLNTIIFLYSSYKNTSYLFKIKGTHISLLKSNSKKPSCNYSGSWSSKLTPKYYKKGFILFFIKGKPRKLLDKQSQFSFSVHSTILIFLSSFLIHIRIQFSFPFIHTVKMKLPLFLFHFYKLLPNITTDSFC